MSLSRTSKLLQYINFSEQALLGRGMRCCSERVVAVHCCLMLARVAAFTDQGGFRHSQG